MLMMQSECNYWCDIGFCQVYTLTEELNKYEEGCKVYEGIFSLFHLPKLAQNNF